MSELVENLPPVRLDLWGEPRSDAARTLASLEQRDNDGTP
ncbi:hypothetical protein BH18ACT4_BH18ACT4_03150 [soil metagenome]